MLNIYSTPNPNAAAPVLKSESDQEPPAVGNPHSAAIAAKESSVDT